MFGILQALRRPSEPMDFHDDVVIERPVDEVYALLDMADPRNSYRQRGHSVVRVGDSPDRFRLVMKELPDITFEISVTDAIPNALYAFTEVSTPKVGRVLAAHEQYSLEPLGPGSCRLRLLNRVTFTRMRPDVLGQERLLVSAACHNTLAKLKIQAEQGVVALDAVADKLIV